MRLIDTNTATLLLATTSVVSAFSPSRLVLTTLTKPSPPSHVIHHINHRLTSALRLSDVSEDPLADMSDERKGALFQALLRDLQIEGVPLLGCGEY